MKICQVYNNAPHYRDSIFHLIDCEFDCDYVFGASLGDIKQMDTSKLQGQVTIVKNLRLGSILYWQLGVQRFLNEKYDAYILLGDTRCLSTWLFCIRAKLTGNSNRIYFWTHGWYGKESRIESWLKKIFFRLAGGGIFLYGNYARELMINEGFDENKLFTIHNSLAYEHQIEIRNHLHENDLYRKHFDNSNPNLIFVGRLTKVKKLDELLHAMARLKKKHKVYNLTLIGDGEMKQDLELMAKMLGLELNVWFYGACYDEQKLGSLIYNADLCVSPGNVGLTAIHVMVFGTPVLTHNDFSRQMPEFEAIHDGETGAFYKRDDIDSLADKIQQWFDTNHSQRDKIRQACYHEIDNQWTPKFQIEVLKNNLKVLKV